MKVTVLFPAFKAVMPKIRGFSFLGEKVASRALPRFKKVHPMLSVGQQPTTILYISKTTRTGRDYVFPLVNAAYRTLVIFFYIVITLSAYE